MNRGPVSGTRYSNVPYKAGNNLSTYEKDRCKLDVYIPRSAGTAPFPVIVYFYGGGLNSGDKSEGWADWSNNFGFKFLEAGISMVMVNYRLSGQQGTKWPVYIQDAAESVAWVANNIGQYGGDPNNIFVMGFSAGAYLTHMLSIDPKWYTAINFDRNRVKGYIPISGQTRAHATVAADLGVQQNQLMTLHANAMPLGQIKKTEKPIHIFVGEYEGQTITDNYGYYNQLISKGSTNLLIYTNPKKDHGGMRDGLGDTDSPTRTKILDFIRTYSSTVNLSPNIAYRKPVIVSSSENAANTGDKAVDANGNTRWASAYSDTQWIYVDLGATYNVNRVKIAWEAAYAKNYYLESSSDAKTWTNVRTITNNAALVNDHTGLSRNARYVRIYATQRATTYGYSIFEFEVYGN